MHERPSVLIIGAGRIGQAFNYLVKDYVASIEFHDSDTEKYPNQKSLSETAPLADIIFLCTLSTAVRSVLEKITPLIKPTALVVSVVKGVERDTHKTMDVVIEESLRANAQWCMIIGPMLAEEITAGNGSAGVVASHHTEALDRLRKIISPSDLFLSYTHDVRGAALCGVLKNIFALGLGIADGLGWGANRKGWLITHALHEMRDAVTLLGGDATTADGPAGLGDLVATGISPHSRNRATGHEIITTGIVNPLSEGAISCASIRNLFGDHAQTFIFLNTIFKVMLESAPAQKTFEKILRYENPCN